MKSQRRHELQTNVLAHWLAQQIEAIKPHWQIVVGVLVGVVLVAVLIVMMNAPRQGSSGPWTSLFEAMQSPESEDTLRNVISRNEGTTPGWYARLALTDLELQHGLRMLFTDRGRAKELLRGALEDYQDVAKNADQESIRRRAKWGIAKTYEGLAATWEKDESGLKKKVSSDLEKAVAAYRKVAAEEPGDSAVGKDAKHNLQRLLDPDGKIRDSVLEVYTAVVDYEQPAPLDASSLPEVPDLSFPGQFSIVPGESEPAPEGSTPEDSTSDKTTPDATKPDSNTPDSSTSESKDVEPKGTETAPQDTDPQPQDDAPGPKGDN
jgi:hypothetical protein